MAAVSLPVAQIHAHGRLRAVREGQVAALADSMAEIGLLQPISVIDATVGDIGETTYHVVTGAHRLLAARRLGWAKIAAEVVARDHLSNRLMEIDENLIRAELSELEKAEHLAERKTVYEALHPVSRKGGDRKSAEAREKNQTAETAVRSFVADAAEKTGDAERTIQVAVRRAEKIAPEARQAIRESGLAHKGVDLDALTRLAPEEQLRAVAGVRDGGFKDLRAAAQALRPRQAPAEVPAPDSVPAAAAMPEAEEAAPPPPAETPDETLPGPAPEPAPVERVADDPLGALKAAWRAADEATQQAFLDWVQSVARDPGLAPAGPDGMPAFLVRKAPHIPLGARRGGPSS